MKLSIFSKLLIDMYPAGILLYVLILRAPTRIPDGGFGSSTIEKLLMLRI